MKWLVKCSVCLGPMLAALGGDDETHTPAGAAIGVQSSFAIDGVIDRAGFDSAPEGLVPRLEGAELRFGRDVRFVDRFEQSPPGSFVREFEAIGSRARMGSESFVRASTEDARGPVEWVGASAWQSRRVRFELQSTRGEYLARPLEAAHVDPLSIDSLRHDVSVLQGDPRTLWPEGKSSGVAVASIAQALSIGGSLNLVPVDACTMGAKSEAYLAALNQALFESLLDGEVDGVVTVKESDASDEQALDFEFEIVCKVDAARSLRELVADVCDGVDPLAPEVRWPGMSRLEATIEWSGTGRVVWRPDVPGTRTISLAGKVDGEVHMDAYGRALGYERLDSECRLHFNGEFDSQLAIAPR